MSAQGSSIQSPDAGANRPLPPPPDPEQASGVRVLIVDDERTIRESCASLLRQYGYTVSTAGKEEEALEILKRQEVNILLLDLYMKGEGGMSILQKMQEFSPETLVIVMTGKPSVESSIEAFRAGAWDYLSKPFSATQLSILIGRATHTVHINRGPGSEAPEEEGALERVGRVVVLGESPAFLKAIDLARRVARTDASVFITGESGTGKELVAQLIHEHGRRSQRELVAVNCAALPEGLLESEMFGHVKGAFTGAVTEKQGLLEQADGGTLFLDELTEMSLGIQAKLLRAIQDGVVRKVGSTDTSALVNVRFIAATNRDPAEAIQEGHLRRDLYYRLRVVPIQLPPLRDRPEDIPVLARHFLAQFWKKHRIETRDRPPELSDQALQSLMRRRWSGNVRELQNVMEHAVVLLDPGQTVEPGDIPAMDDGVGTSDGAGVGPLTTIDDQLLALPYHEARDRVLATFEEQYLKEVVRRADGNMSKAARMAGVDRTTLYRLMQKHEVSKDQVLED
ncbi:MAG: sigma-54-dependent Fis family transcriptional regulator [Gemmatimonadales bacterium]|nr:MAG: sigma-54-dependent Fis family transcriptional regulator [Gemmatimonadales bacterium]